VQRTHRAAIVLWLALGCPLLARAQDPPPGTSAFPPVALFGDDNACPTPAQVASELKDIVPSLLVVLEEERSGAFSARIRDEGPHFVVTADGKLRQFDDADRDCVLRARKAAVFLSLVLPQPGTPAPAAPKPPVPAAPKPPVVNSAPPRPAKPPWTPRWVPAELEVGGVFAASPGTGAALTGGGAVRVFFGSRYVGGVLSAAGLAPFTLHFANAGARITRVPFELGVRGRLPLRRVTLSLDATLVLGALITQGVEITPSASARRLEVGVALTARAEYWVTPRLAPFLQLAFEGIPSAYDFTVPGGATVGSSPKIWLTTTAGLAVRL
jgi:hypothetical protein